jgi:uncharacterized protein (DUF342 family)
MTDNRDSRQGKSGNQQDIKIVFHGDTHWKVRILFSSREAVDREMVECLRSAKNLIAKHHGVPVELLELTEILERSPSRKGFAITINIGKIFVEQGQPVFSFLPMETPNGVVLEDMVAELDIPYLDETNKPVTPDRLSDELERKGLDPSLCDQGAIREAVKKVIETKSAVRGLVVARGILPEEGENARLDYSLCGDLNGDSGMNGKFKDRKTKRSDVLCRKTSPTRGKKPGKNVFGKEIPPLYGLDIDLADGEGTSLTDHGDGLVAIQDGVAHVSVDYRTIRTDAGEESFPETIRISVKPVLRLQGEDVGDLIVADSVEVDGSIGDGAAVTTQGEFYMSGDLETGAVIRAGSDVRINGRIMGGEISSDRSVRSSSEVTNTVIIAGHHVELEGVVEGASITGHVVKLNESRGSSIVADSRVEMERAGNDASGRETSIQVGRMDFYLDKVKSNKKTISELSSYLLRIRDLFGSENVLRINQSNIQFILVQHLKSLRRVGNTDVKESTVQSMKKLLEEVAPLRNIITQKSREIDLFKEKAKEKSATPPVIIISEMTSDPVTVSLNGKQAVVGPLARPSSITTSPDGDVKTLPLYPPSGDSPEQG